MCGLGSQMLSFERVVECLKSFLFILLHCLQLCYQQCRLSHWADWHHVHTSDNTNGVTNVCAPEKLETRNTRHAKALICCLHPIYCLYIPMAGGSHTGFYINCLRSSSGFHFLIFPLLSLSASVEFEWATLSKNSKTFHRMLDGVVISPPPFSPQHMWVPVNLFTNCSDWDNYYITVVHLPLSIAPPLSPSLSRLCNNQVVPFLFLLIQFREVQLHYQCERERAKERENILEAFGFTQIFDNNRMWMCSIAMLSCGYCWNFEKHFISLE